MDTDSRVVLVSVHRVSSRPRRGGDRRVGRESFDLPETEFRGSRAVQGRQGRGAVGAAEHEWGAHRRSTASCAVPIKLKVAEGTAVHAPVALVRLPLLLQHHAPPFCAGVLEPDLPTTRIQCMLLDPETPSDYYYLLFVQGGGGEGGRLTSIFNFISSIKGFTYRSSSITTRQLSKSH